MRYSKLVRALIALERGLLEIRQQEFRNRNFDTAEFPVVFQNFSKLHRNFDSIVEIPKEFQR